MEEKHWLLISKSLTKEISEEEEKEFVLWLNADVRNKTLFEEAKKAWAQSASVPFDFEPDTETAWEKVKSKMDAPALKGEEGVALVMKEEKYITPFWISIPTLSGRVGASFLWKAAAILIVVIGVTLIAKQISDQNNDAHPTFAETYTTTSEKSFVQLTDGSQAWLNKNTTLSCDADFNKQERTVYLAGEAFFEVTKDATKPFIIFSGTAKTTVMGTSFNLRAYKNEKNTELVVSSGKVSFLPTEASAQAGAMQTDAHFKGLILEKGEKGIINNETGEAIKSINDEINYLAWKEEKLVFNKTEMEKVAKDLEKYFSVKIEIESPAIRKCYFTGTFEKPKLEDVLKVFKVTMNIDYRKEKNKIILFGKGCN